MRDRIVLSCPDSCLQERLLREADLILDKALVLCRVAETTQQQMHAIKTGSDLPSSTLMSIEAVNSQHYATQRKTCGNCDTSHVPKACPAYGKDCSGCHKRNHFAAYCRSSNETEGHGTIVNIAKEVMVVIVQIVVLTQRRRHRSASSSQMKCMTRCS